jgi:uncharacterized membrane protein YbhN (UPF0104 family)
VASPTAGQAAGQAALCQRPVARLATLGGLRPRWLGFAAAAETVSMVAFALLEKGLLCSGRLTGRGLTLRSVLATAYRANAIAIMVPVAGSGMATAYAYREFRRRGIEPAHIVVALTVAGVCSTVTFAAVAAVAALLTGNVVAAVLAGAGGAAGAVAAGAVLLSLRYARTRGWLEAAAVLVLRTGRRIIRWPRAEPAQFVADAVARVGAVRIGYRVGWQALGWAWWTSCSSPWAGWPSSACPTGSRNTNPGPPTGRPGIRRVRARQVYLAVVTD